MSDSPEPVPPLDEDSDVGAPGEIPFARPVPWTPPVPPDTDPMLLRASSRSAAWVDILTFVGLFLGCEIVAGVVIGATVGVEAGESSEPHAKLTRKLLLPIVAVRVVSTAVVLALLLRARRQTAGSLGLTARALPVNLALGGALTVACFLLIWIVYPVLWLVWPDLIRQLQENTDRLREMVPPLSPAGFLALTLAVGFYEELIFRGFLMTRLRRATGSWVAAVLLQTALFTSLHVADQTPAALIPVSMLGIICAASTIWRRSLVPAVVGHTLFNFVQFLWLYSQLGDAWK